ncbi:hypothetical protein Jab_1c18780 [Janthinobacterium sp. HH01]|uniref:hypothetical protein n=1 Tax=Janthinobacterium sp. HH01 TaxID=1198452 RepID=UPI0002AEA5D0|nr:hypothetical protein [Janthinobacterium sp. HH01]ELX13256.1 hypothetical protein Jab_1c18780 [Janthinobacterium sp. HH01]
MWKALLTILSTLSVQKSTPVPVAGEGDFSNFSLRFFYAWKKYPYKSTTLYTVALLANNLIHIFCAELHMACDLATFGGWNYRKDKAYGMDKPICQIFTHGNNNY